MWFGVALTVALALSTFYALGRWHGEWRYRRTWEAGYRAGYRAALGDMARNLHVPRQRWANERQWPRGMPTPR